MNPTQPDRLTVGLAQIAPVFLDRKQTLAKVADWVCRAADAGCRLVAFGEALAPGYPFWLSATHGSRFESPLQKQLHAHYLEQSIDLTADHLDGVRRVAAEHGIEVMLGCSERAADRGGHTLYCSLVSIDASGAIRHAHRKLMPTYEERLAWGIGDGHGLRVFPLGRFTVGGLNCWENWMPTARSVLYAEGEDLHVAVWPGSQRNTQDITRYVAKESRSWVLSVSGLLRHEDVPDDFPGREEFLAGCPELLADGGSCIARPDGEWEIEPAVGSEQLLVATIDHQRVRQERQNFDPSGHYSRPDVVSLRIDRRRQRMLEEDA